MDAAMRKSAAPRPSPKIGASLGSKAETWIDRETAGSNFKDERLCRRFKMLLKGIGGAMGKSIPLVCQDWANTKAAYRFFSNDRVSEEDIMGGHFQSTRARFAASKGTVLVLQDTTEFTYRRERPELIGFTKSINSGKDKAGRLRKRRYVEFDAFEPRGDDRRSSAGAGGHQVLDQKEIQRQSRFEEEDQPDADSDRKEREHSVATKFGAVHDAL